MSKTTYWMLELCTLALLLSITSVGSAKGFADKFRAFILDSQAVTPSTRSQLNLPQPLRSHHCMECHDGSAGRRISLKHAEAAMRFLAHGSIDHPVGMRYTSYASNNPTLYVSPDQLDNRIILEDGEVTCLSCHETKLHANGTLPRMVAQENAIGSIDQHQSCTATDRLTTGNNRMTLCLSCHTI
jgi:hypothetical protein